MARGRGWPEAGGDRCGRMSALEGADPPAFVPIAEMELPGDHNPGQAMRPETGLYSLDRQALVEKGGLATAKSKVFIFPFSVKYGLDSELSFQISAVGLSCKIIFILARAAVALSISWP